MKKKWELYVSRNRLAKKLRWLEKNSRQTRTQKLYTTQREKLVCDLPRRAEMPVASALRKLAAKPGELVREQAWIAGMTNGQGLAPLQRDDALRTRARVKARGSREQTREQN